MVNHWIDAGLSVICKGGSAYSDDLKTCEVNSQAVKDGLNLFGDLVQSKAMPDDTAAKSLPKEQLLYPDTQLCIPLAVLRQNLLQKK